MLGAASDRFVALRAPHPSEQTQRAMCLRGGGVKATAFIAGANDYFDRLGRLRRIGSALLAILLWPLILLGIDLQIT